MILLLLLLLTSHLIQISSMSLFALEASERWLLLFPESSDLHSWQGDLSGRSEKFWELKVRSRENRFRLFTRCESYPRRHSCFCHYHWYTINTIWTCLQWF